MRWGRSPQEGPPSSCLCTKGRAPRGRPAEEASCTPPPAVLSAPTSSRDQGNPEEHPYVLTHPRAFLANSGEYIYALKDLTYATFCGAISEKFCDLYWGERLLQNLFRVVNGRTPPSEK